MFLALDIFGRSISSHLVLRRGSRRRRAVFCRASTLSPVVREKDPRQLRSAQLLMSVHRSDVKIRSGKLAESRRVNRLKAKRHTRRYFPCINDFLFIFRGLIFDERQIFDLRCDRDAREITWLPIAFLAKVNFRVNLVVQVMRNNSLLRAV